jgi:hypothetical protein
MRPLYAITHDFQELDRLLEAEEQNDELTDTMVKIMESLEKEEGVKLDNYIDYINHITMMRDEAKKQGDYWRQKQTTLDSKIDYLCERMREHMTARGIKKVVSATGRSVTLVANGGKRRITYIGAKADAEKVIGTEYEKYTQPISLVIWDGEAVRKALEAGHELPFAVLEERGSHVRIG